MSSLLHQTVRGDSINQTRSVALVFLLLASGGTMAVAEPMGGIAGRVVSSDGDGVGGVIVHLLERASARVTDPTGSFAFAAPAGVYTVEYNIGGHVARAIGVRVSAGETVDLVETVDWDLHFATMITVTGVSRQRERIAEAPGAVTVVSQQEIELESAAAAIPRMLSSATGIEAVQHDVNDFSLNARGFNGYTNRRLLYLIDGRDPSAPANAGTNEWYAMSFPLDDIASMEMVRGPVAALYGAGAVNGVLNVRTKSAEEALGGKVRFTLGELDTRRLEARYAANLGDGWAFKVVGGYHSSEDYTESRVDKVEYPGLPKDVIPPPLDRQKSAFGSVRVDKTLERGHLVTLEGGYADLEGQTFPTGVGRVQVVDGRRPWARFNYNTSHWNILGYYTGRQENNEASLGSGVPLFLDSLNAALEVQGNFSFADGRGRAVLGGTVGRLSSDSRNDEGKQTIFARELHINRGALFGQIDYDISDRLKGVLSLRWDDSSVIDGRISPRAALVYSPTPHHTLRVHYGEAFQAPTLAFLFIELDVAPPLDLSALEAALAPSLNGVPLDFGSIRFLGVGKESLEAETGTTLELGYSGLVGDRLFVTASYYHNILENFTTGFLPQIGTSLGRVNEDFGPYQPPPELSPEAAATVIDALRGALPSDIFESLSNFEDGSPLVAFLSVRNFGRVTADGVELGAEYALSNVWRLGANYSYFDFNVDEELPEQPLIANKPTHAAALNIAYNGAPISAALSYRWVDAFDWREGIYVGRVPAYGVVDLAGSYALSPSLTVGFDVANVLDDDHFESFGGNLLRRRALAYASYAW